jgi:hypothetical protein
MELSIAAVMRDQLDRVMKNFTMQIENATAIDQISSDVLSTLAAPGWANKYDVLVDGKPTPINYNIIGGQLVGMLANPDRHALYLALNPSPQSDGGAVEVQLPRNFIDSKTSGNEDKPYVAVMDGDRIRAYWNLYRRLSQHL